MTSHDVRDMLNLPGEAAPRPTKKQKISAPRPILKGLAREVQNLGGDNPISIVPEAIVFKKRRFGARKPAARWEMRPFKNSAREDKELVLRHWRRKAEVPAGAVAEEGSSEQVNETKAEPEIEDSTFAKYNVRVSTPQYDAEIYNSRLQSDDWTKEETDYLMDLVQEFDLRWPVIWDRYEYTPSVPPMEEGASDMAIIPARRERSMEEMKARYYFIAAQMMQVNKKVEIMNGAEFNLLELMRSYNPQIETMRKKFAEASFHRTKEEAREEESLLVELRRILARSEKLSQERAELYQRLEAPASTGAGSIGVYASSQGLQQLLQQLMTADKSKKNRRSIMGGEGVSPAGPGSSMSQQPTFDRRDSSVRESISGPSGGANNKKGPQQGPTERRQLGPDEEALFGVRHFERITTSGPAFRHDRIMKPVTTKSTIQQTKITNILTELGIRPRLVMPTYSVGVAYESLLQVVCNLLDVRKNSEKLQGEINTVKALIIEKQKLNRPERGEVESTGAESTVVGETSGENGGMENVRSEEREKSAALSVRPSSSGQHKRSGSVLSTVSDKSTKRQKRQ